MGIVIPFCNTEVEPLPELEREFIPHDERFPMIPYEALRAFCNGTSGWKITFADSRAIIDAGFPLETIVKEFRGYEDYWLIFVRVLLELVEDYMPTKLRGMIGKKITSTTEPEIRSLLRSREASIISAGGRPFHEELRYRLGISGCMRKVHFSCNVTEVRE